MHMVLMSAYIVSIDEVWDFPLKTYFSARNDSVHDCKEWLRQARTCPVCHMDIPGSLGILDDEWKCNATQ
jgi:hypothetical protein